MFSVQSHLRTGRRWYHHLQMKRQTQAGERTCSGVCDLPHPVFALSCLDMRPSGWPHGQLADLLGSSCQLGF